METCQNWAATLPVPACVMAITTGICFCKFLTYRLERKKLENQRFVMERSKGISG